MMFKVVGVIAGVVLFAALIGASGGQESVTPDVEKGKTLFFENCGACHIHKGRLGPQLREDTKYFIESGFPGEGMWMLLEGSVRKVREDSPMPTFTQEMVSTEDLMHIGAYFTSFWKDTEVVYEMGTAEKGAAIYKAQCGVCHGMHGEGTSIAMPLALLTKELKQAGAPPRTMLGFTRLAARSGDVKGMKVYSQEDISDDELGDLAAFIWSLAEPGKETGMLEPSH